MSNPSCPESLRKLARVDAIFLTHGHSDHFGDMALIGKLYQPQLAMLPVGDRYTMGPREAAYAVRLLGVKHVIPMHYATLPVLTGSPQAFRGETRDIPDLTIHQLEPGDSL